MEKWNCIIADDEEVDRLTVVSFVKRFPHLNLLAVFTSAEEALQEMEKQQIDIMFLDIDMPGVSGIEIRKQLKHIPVCVFITAHPEHAVESFEVEALDFIVKPIKFDRFSQMMSRVEAFMNIREKSLLYESSLGGDAIFIKEGHEQVKVKLHEILYLEALKDYTLLITTQKRHCVLSNIGTLLGQAHFSSFVRVHRSFAVQKQRVNKVSSGEVEMDNAALVPVGRSYKENLILLT